MNLKRYLKIWYLTTANAVMADVTKRFSLILILLGKAIRIILFGLFLLLLLSGKKQLAGYSIDQAMTREEAFQRIEGKGYRLVLLDLRIPGVKGLELLETIRARMPEAKVIIITGYASIETAVESARLGAVDYLPKPFTPDEIRKVTENAFLLAA